MNQQLYDQLLDAGRVLVERENAKNEIKNLLGKIDQNNLDVEEAKKKIKIKFTGRLVIGIIFLAIFGEMLLAAAFSMVLLLFASGDVLQAILFGVIYLFLFGIPSIIGFCLLISIPISKKKHTKKYTAVYQQIKEQNEISNAKMQQRIEQIKQEIGQYLVENQQYLNFLPEDYQNIHAVGFMIKAVHNLRADTLKEAINLYDLELKHLEAMEAAERQRLQNESLRYTMELMNANQERGNRILTGIHAVQVINSLMD